MRCAFLVACVLAAAGCDQVFGITHVPSDAPPDAPPPQRWERVAAGGVHTCGLRVDGTLWCWGRNVAGVLGLGDAPADFERREPARVGSKSDWRQLVSGETASCAIDAAAGLFCWGSGESGKLGNGGLLDRNEPISVPGSWASVAMGKAHACGIQLDGTLWCWGSSADGRLGNAATDNAAHPSPIAIAPGTTWKQVAAGENSTCAIDSTDALSLLGTEWPGTARAR